MGAPSGPTPTPEVLVKGFVGFLLQVAAFLYLVLQACLMGVALIPAVLFVRLFWDTGNPVLIAFGLALGYVLFGFVFLLLVVLLKQLTFFRAREGDYPFLSAYAIRWVFLGSLMGIAKLLILRFLLGMPVLNLFYRLMGARIGRGVVINTCNMFDFDLLEIGDGTFVGGDAVVIGHVGEGGFLKLRPVRIGRGCTVGQSSVVFPGAVMEDGSVLGALSLLPKGRTLPGGSVWGGNPLVEIRHEKNPGP